MYLVFGHRVESGQNFLTAHNIAIDDHQAIHGDEGSHTFFMELR